MTKPDRIARFATDDTFAAGSDAWSGQPNKVAPADPAKGIEPNEKYPAETANYQHHYAGEWSAELASLYAQTFPQIGYFASPVINFNRVLHWRGYDDGNWNPKHFLFGIADNVVNGLYSVEPFQLAEDAGVTQYALTGSVTLRDIAARDDVGELIAVGNSNDYYESTDSGTSFSDVHTFATAAADMHCCVWDPVNALFIVGGDDGSKALIETCPDAGASGWAVQHNPAATDFVDQLVTDGAGTTLAVSGDVVFRSTDGTTWSDVADLNGLTRGRLAYNASRGLWMYATIDGDHLYTSPDGESWTPVSGWNGASFPSGGFLALAGDGAVWVAAYDADSSGPFTIATSIDDGVTWQVTPAPNVFQSISSLAFFEGQLILCGDRTIALGPRSLTSGREIRDWI